MNKKEQLEMKAQNRLWDAKKRFEREIGRYQKAKYMYSIEMNSINRNFCTADYHFENEIEKLCKYYGISDIKIDEFKDKEVFKYISNNDISYPKYYLKTSSKSLKEISPKNIKQLAIALSAHKNAYLYQKLLKNIKNKQNIDYINPILKPVLKETFGVILFEEQIQKIISLILDKDKILNRLFLNEIDGYSYRELIPDNDNELFIENIRKKYPVKYSEKFKIPYYSFKNQAEDKGLNEEESEKLFNMLLIAISTNNDEYKRKALLNAKMLYKIAFVKLKKF